MLRVLDRLATDHPLDSTALLKALVTGGLVSAVYSICQIILNGIVIDEAVIAAQVITGAVEYPPGHPHGPYYQGIYSLLHYLAALVWWLIPSPLVISAVQNFVYLFLSLFSVFALTLVITRRTVWAYVSVTLVVFDAYLRFTGVYPLSAFPHIYSNGHNGLHLTVLIIALMFGGLWRSSGLLLGLYPGVHAVHALIMWFGGALYLWSNRISLSREAMRRVFTWGGLGLVVCILLGVAINLLATEAVALAPYLGEANGTLIREQFLLRTDVHRRTLPLDTFGYLVNPVAFFALGLVAWWRAKSQGAAKQAGASAGQIGWLLLLGGAVWGYIYTFVLLTKLGVRLPDLVIISMPGRFSNITAVLLLPLTVVALSAAFSALQRPLKPIAVAIFAALLLVCGLAASGLFAFAGVDRLEIARSVIFVVWGLLFGLEFHAGFNSRWQRRSVVIAWLLVLLSLALFLHETFVVFYFLAAGVGSWLVLKLGQRQRADSAPPAAMAGRIAASVVLLGLLVSLVSALPDRDRDLLEPQYRRWDMISDYDRQLAAWLDAHASDSEMILAFTGPLPRSELQAKLTRPVLFELKSIWIMSYKPELSAVLGKMTRDLYGIDYSRPDELQTLCADGLVGVWCPVWKQNWLQRSRDEWQTLGERYNFRLVLSRSNVPLQLPVALPGPRWTLYLIE